nr:prolyl oligopeptidase family serine peptidase [Rathayibacter rathayi]
MPAHRVQRWIATPPSSLIVRRLRHPRPWRPTVYVVARRENTITLRRSKVSKDPGEYALRRGNSTLHIGPVLPSSSRSVTRQLIASSGDASEITGRWDWESSFYNSPQPGSFAEHELGGGARVLVSQEFGGLWVVHVHGHSVGVQQTFRGIRSAAAAGYASLLVQHAEESMRGRPFGEQQITDVVDAVAFARERGAERVVLMGWSLGAAFVLSAAARTRVEGIIAVSPVFTVADLVRDVCTRLRLPQETAHLTLRKLGVTEPPTGQPNGADVPMLVLHSAGDTVAPLRRSIERADAAQNAELVIVEDAPHTLEWNVDRVRFEREVQGWLKRNSESATVGEDTDRGKE